MTHVPHGISKVGFTGFGFDKTALHAYAKQNGFWPTRSMNGLRYLVIGKTPTEWRVQEANAKGIEIITMPEFEKITGTPFSSLASLDQIRPLPIQINFRKICFTGFSKSEEAELTVLAQNAGYRVVKSISRSLQLLVTGTTPGPKKIVSATEYGVKILPKVFFLAMLENNISPEDIVIGDSDQ